MFPPVLRMLLAGVALATSLTGCLPTFSLSDQTGQLPTSEPPVQVAAQDLDGDGASDFVIRGETMITVTLTGTEGDDYALGGTAGEVVVRDLNGDRAPDIVAAVPGGGGYRTLINNGSGVFALGALQAIPGAPSTVVAGDLDGDGDPDLVFGTSDGYSVLLGAGDGTFGAPADTGLSSSPAQLELRDVTGDGRLDLFDVRDGDVRMHPGAGDGSFGAATDTDLTEAKSLLVRDVSGDGIPDLVAIRLTDDFLDIARGEGDGTFDVIALPSLPLVPGGDARVVETGDLNSDGTTDLVVTNHATDQVSVFLGDLSGQFLDGRDYAAGDGPIGVATADVLRDGVQDVVVADNEAPGALTLLFGQQNGVLATKNEYGTGVAPRSVAAGDVNEDGKPDLAVANFVSNTLSVRLGGGDGTFGVASDFAVPGGPRAVALQDVNNDEHLDLISANFNSANVAVLLGDGAGDFDDVSPITTATGAGPTAIGAGDLDGDGNLDVVVAEALDNKIGVLLGQGDGTFDRTPYPAGADPSSVDLADMDDDGDLDMLVVNGSSNTLAVYLNDGDGVFAPPSTLATGVAPSWVDTGDLDGDSDTDAVVTNLGDETVSVYLGNGDGTLTAADPVSSTGGAPATISIADMSGNGVLDLVTAAGGGELVGLYAGAGDGTFEGRFDVALGTDYHPYSLITEDLNNDSRPDLAVVSGTVDKLTVILNTAPVPDSTTGKEADLHVTGSVLPSPPAEGAEARWTFRVANEGGADAMGVEVVADLQGLGLDPVISWTCTASGTSSCANADGSGTNSVDETGSTIKVGEHLTYEITATLDAGTTGDLVIAAARATSGPAFRDPDPEDDDAFVTRTVVTNTLPEVTAGTGSAAWTEGDNVASAPVVVAPDLELTDAEHLTLPSATVSVTGNLAAGQDVLGFVNDGSTMGNVAVSSSAGGALVLTSAGSTATLGQWQAALRAVTYDNSSESPSVLTRTVTFAANDGIGSGSATRDVTISAVDDRPVVTVDAGVLGYTEGQAATAISPGLTVTDADSPVTEATVAVIGDFAAGEDVLGFSDQNGITGTFDSGTGVLTLTGTAPAAAYQAALRSVTYRNTSTGPSTAVRTVAFRARSSASLLSTTAMRAIGPALNAPASTVAPTVPSLAREGVAHSSAPGTWTGSTPIALATRWQRCEAGGAGCADIAGATGSGYTPGAADVGRRLRVVVTATNPHSAVAAASLPTDVVRAPLAAPAITGGPEGAVEDLGATFGFSASEAGLTFECRVDAGTFAACASPFSITVGPGPRRFSVRARDAAGSVGPAASRDWTAGAALGPATPPATATPVLPRGSITVDGDRLTVGCAVDRGSIASCAVDAFLVDGSLGARAAKQARIGHGRVAFDGRGIRRAAVPVTLTAAGLRALRRAGGSADVVFALRVRVFDSGRVLRVSERAEVEVPDRHVVIGFPASSATLDEAGARRLARLARALRKGVAAVRCEGHADATATAEYEHRIALQRARTVCAFLRSRGVGAPLTAISLGATRPVATNDTPEGRARNRRVEIVVR